MIKKVLGYFKLLLVYRKLNKFLLSDSVGSFALNPDVDSARLLDFAVKRNNLDVVDFLLENGVKSENALKIALKYSRFNIAFFIVDACCVDKKHL